MRKGIHCSAARDGQRQIVGIGWIQQRNAGIGLQAAKGTLGFYGVIGHHGPGRGLAPGARGGWHCHNRKDCIFIGIGKKLLSGNVVCSKYGYGFCCIKRRTAANADDEIRMVCPRLRTDGTALLHIGIVANAFKHTAFDFFMGERSDHISKGAAGTPRALASYNKRACAQTQCSAVALHNTAAKMNICWKAEPKFHKNLRDGIKYA